MPNAFDRAKGPSVDSVRAKATDGKVRVGDVSQFKDTGLSVEDAKKAMDAAGESPRGIRGTGGNTPVVQQPATPAVPTANQVKLTLLELDGSDGESTIFTIDPAKADNQTVFPNGAALRAAIMNVHARAQKAGRQLRVDALVPGQEIAPVPPVSSEPAVPVQVNSVVSEQVNSAPAERLETVKFVLEIRQDNGKWIGEITYKNGSGVERFEANTRKELDMKLLEGKANATLKVREVIRREKYGVELDSHYQLPNYVTQEEWDAMKPAQQQLTIDTIAAQQAMIFKQEHPDYYPTSGNTEKISKFLDHAVNPETHQRGLPYTARNLAYAFEELLGEGELEIRPEPVQASVPSAPVVAAPAGDSAAPATTVRKRGSTGLLPGNSTVVTSPIETTEEKAPKIPQEPSVAELRQLSDADLQSAYRKTMAEKARLRNF